MTINGPLQALTNNKEPIMQSLILAAVLLGPQADLRQLCQHQAPEQLKNYDDVPDGPAPLASIGPTGRRRVPARLSNTRLLKRILSCVRRRGHERDRAPRGSRHRHDRPRRRHASAVDADPVH